MAGPNKRISRTTNRFSEIPKAEIRRSTFNRSHGLKTTFNAGLLVPIYVDEALPGDTFSMSMNGFARLATPLHPFMDNLYLDTFYFFVPNRLLWDNWVRFMGERKNPSDSIDYTVPRMSNLAAQPNDLADYMGIPTGAAAVTANALHFRAYNLIWNEWFRDQDLQTQAFIATNDGPDDYTLYTLKRRGKRHDYFTSGRPWTQKGDPVTIPLGTEARVISAAQEGDPVNVLPEGGSNYRRLANAVVPPAVGENVVVDSIGDGNANRLYADLTNATAATINELRQAFQIQRLLERDARGGTRYTEIIHSHFRVQSPDARLQRPEYLGGGTTQIMVNPVAQTTPEPATGTVTPQGNLAAVGTASWQGHSWRKSFTEHGVIIGLACVRADLTYQQGLHRMWWRQTRYDFFWPSLQHLGEQSIYNGEIFYGDDGQNTNTFAFQERNAEYRYAPSRITGTFRSDHPQSLDTWHLAQDFGTRPTLNDTFIQENPPVDRVIAVTDEPHFIADMWFNLRCARPMPVYGVPGLIDHF